MSDEQQEFKILAEWVIRKLRKIDFENADKETIIRWVLYSLGVEKTGQDIYLYLRERGSATTTEIAEYFNMSPTTARKYLEQLHTLGLVDYIGREYHLSFEDLGKSIRSALVPRINDVLRELIRATRSISREEFEEEFISPVADMKTALLWSTGKLKRDLAKLKKEIKKIAWTGIDTSETDDEIRLDVFASYTLTGKDVQRCMEKGKKLVVNVFGSLRISEDIEPEDIEFAVKKITVFGTLTVPKKILEKIVGKLEVFGSIRTI